MVAFVITDGNGKYIRKDEGGRKYVPVIGEKYAYRFTETGKANNVLHNSVCKTIRDMYYVDTINIEEPKVNKNETIIKSIAKSNIIDDDILRWIEKVDSFAEFSESILNRENELNERLSTIDKEVSDIQHFIEFGKLNAYQGWLSMSMLQNRLRQRRKYKDELYVIGLISNCKLDQKSISELHTLINDMNGRKYSPRVLSELFKDTDR